ncbi:unnamed protein product [Rhizoctonia solani]|uniref:Transmembrane protein n=1 Tax=Rhizoctonia solani TaxID=456999 RepID=A0A8H3GEU4_9AGAM|nr:unnamed protein product [Rhizoctonia solani]
MIAFSRLSAFLLFVLSLSFLTCAAPTSSKTQELSVRGGDCHTVINALADLEAKLKLNLDACVAIKADVDINAEIIAKVKADIEATAHVVASVGAIVDVDAKLKAEVITHIATVVTLVAKILIKLSAKISASVMANIILQIDACLKALLVALNVCIQGVVSLSLKAIVDLTVVVFIKVKLLLCADILGLLKVGIAL